jgi:hypothetical protein
LALHVQVVVAGSFKRAKYLDKLLDPPSIQVVNELVCMPSLIFYQAPTHTLR